MVTTNSIALTATGLVGYDGAGTFNATTIPQGSVVTGGGSTSTYISVAPPNNAGTPLVSQTGVNSPPVFGTCEVRGGGTGLTTLSTFQLMAAGTGSTTSMQQIGIGSVNQILTSNGAGALATFQTLPVISSWVVQGASTTAVSSTGYFVTSGTAVITLPTGLSTGATISIYNYIGLSVVINAGTGQTINIGVGTSTSGGTATRRRGRR